MATQNISRERRIVQEKVILAATEAIWAEMKRTGVRKVDLADTLQVSKAYVTQALDGGRNLTLRTVADFAFALGCEVRLDLASEAFDESKNITLSSAERESPGKPKSKESAGTNSYALAA